MQPPRTEKRSPQDDPTLIQIYNMYIYTHIYIYIYTHMYQVFVQTLTCLLKNACETHVSVSKK